jgi:hypothetical protein
MQQARQRVAPKSDGASFANNGVAMPGLVYGQSGERKRFATHDPPSGGAEDI